MMLNLRKTHAGISVNLCVFTKFYVHYQLSCFLNISYHMGILITILVFLALVRTKDVGNR